MYKELFVLIREHYQTDGFIPLHAPCFDDLEKQYLNQCIDSTFVSSVGEFVGEFEQQVASFTGAKHAIAVVNGTMGLFLALKTVGVENNDLVLTQSLTFVATANAISMLGANPVFLDVDQKTLGLCPQVLADFLATQTYQQSGKTYHQQTKQLISACVPMHTLGFALEIDKIVAICKQYNIKVVEDAAESLGSFYQQQHTGTFAEFGIFSFNGNKILTTGGGGILVTNNDQLAKQAKHLSTTAKIPHQWLFEHDEIAYNLRMPNLNAALGVAQMRKLDEFLIKKHQLAKKYQNCAAKSLKKGGVFKAKTGQSPNYWLNTLVLDSVEQRDLFLAQAQTQQIQARPLWTPLHQLDIYKHEIQTLMPNTQWLFERLVNIPSGVA
jgi:aminotransferase in exopolysaccharide biosynthesis